MRRAAFGIGILVAGLALPRLAAPAEPVEKEPEAEARPVELSWGLEAKAAYRDSRELRLPSPFPFPPEFLPPGATQGFLATVDPGQHFEIPAVTLFADAAWGESVAAHVKIDLIDLWDRNPTSSDHRVDVDELWIRFGRDPGQLDGRSAAYAKVGKFAHFERQNDRHLESYGLISTAFNRFEDSGLELGAALGKHFYARVSATSGNPLFFRDPNALAGDNGTPDRDPSLRANPVPRLEGGFPILYDAEVEDIGSTDDLELGYGLGLRFGEPGGGRELNLLAWHYERDLAATVTLEGTFYGGDLDLLNGPFDGFSLPISGNKKRENGANLWVYLDGFSLFGQYVDQDLAGMKRTGWEAEAAWHFDLPLVRAAAGRQLFPSIQPAIRYSRLEPEFGGGSKSYPAPSVRWPWTKIDYGVRIGLIEGVDLTIEFADNEMTLANGRKVSNDELLSTLRWRI